MRREYLTYEGNGERIVLRIRRKAGLLKNEITIDLKSKPYLHTRGFFVGSEVTTEDVEKKVLEVEFPL